MPEKLQPVVDAAKAYLSDFSEARNRFLDRVIDNPKLRILFIERRETLARFGWSKAARRRNRTNPLLY